GATTMRTRGRRPAAESAVIVTWPVGQRPDPPPGLTDRQAEIWRQVVTTEDANFFASAALQHFLGDYCRHRDMADRITDLINKSFQGPWESSPDMARLQRLLTLRGQEARAAAGMATKLRVTNQARYMPRGAARASLKAPQWPSPWES